MFKDSCITELRHWMALEESSSLPSAVFPAYIGSGECILSLDASGLQGLNNGVQKAFGSRPDAGDLYTVLQGMVGDCISRDNVLPLGFFEWDMELDGEKIDTSNLKDNSSVWSRKIFIDEGRVVTRMLLMSRLILEISTWIPFGSMSPVLEIGLKGYDRQNRAILPVRNVTFHIFFNIKTRQGKFIYKSADFDGRLLNLQAEGHEVYKHSLKLDNDHGLEPEFCDDKLGLTWSTSVGSEEEKIACVFSFDGKFNIGALNELRLANWHSWHEYYSKVGDIYGIDIKESYLYHNSLYLMRLGFRYDYGVQIGTPFNQPWCWRASTFWDSHFVMEALMRAGAREAADKFIDFLYRSLRNDRKPFSWMFMYDGTPTIEDKYDIAPFDIATHAMTTIKHYEYFRDDSLLEEKIFPICKAVSDYAVNNLFEEVEGQWIVSYPVSNDVVDKKAAEINQTYTILWHLVVMRKTVEYAQKLGKSKLLDSRYVKILKGYYIEKNDQEYMHSKNITASEHHCASWIPFLLYPTEGMPFIDMELFRKTRGKYSFMDLYMEKQGDFQPWLEFIQASSDFRADKIEEGYRMRQIGLRHAYGPGFFCEVGPCQETCALPPYISAHGSYITALLYQFLTSSIWDRKIGIFSSMPIAYRGKDIHLRNILCIGNLKVSASYTPMEITAEIEGNLQGHTIEIPIPEAITEECVRVLVNGCLKKYNYNSNKKTIEIKIDEDVRHYTVIVR